MDSQLKALKVAELKRVLTDAGISVTARATKADLIARVLDSQDAQRVYRTIYGLPQPQVSVPQPVSVPTPTPTPTLPPAPAPTTTAPTTLATADVQEPVAPQPDKPLSPEDAELEKRKARAARFGIPFIPPVATNGSLADDPTKLNARAARFGTENSTPHSPQVDPEELEKRRKRAERFATTAPDMSS